MSEGTSVSRRHRAGADWLRAIPALAAAATLVASVGLSPGLASASPHKLHAGSWLNDSGVPSGSTEILNITMAVTNDEDSGFCGYWALDDYNKSVQVYQVPAADVSTLGYGFYAIVRYTGDFTTYVGVPTPGQGTTEACPNDTPTVFVSTNESGTMNGGYVATFTGNFAPGTQATNGNIGSFNYGGTASDVLKGTYSNGQTGNSPADQFDWVSAYFPGITGANLTLLNWGWTYTDSSQSWSNFASGAAGDIS